MQQRWQVEQWLVDREQITPSTTRGWRARVLLSRSLCLFYCQDLSHIPATRRPAALAQQIKLLSPFAKPGFYASWQGGKVQLWLWDQAALFARVPQAEHCLVLPDSALSPLGKGEESQANEGEEQAVVDNTAHNQLHGIYSLQGINGQEQQTWHQGELKESRWVKGCAELNQNRLNNERVIVLNLSRAAPLQAADKRLLGHLVLGVMACVLLAILLLQTGGVLSLWQQQQGLEQVMQLQNEQNKVQRQAMRSATNVRELWLARQTLLQQPSQVGYLQQLGAVLPSEASIWQRYRYEPGRLQLLLTDPTPDPRDYVRIISRLPNTTNVQVQLDPAHQTVTIQADLTKPVHVTGAQS